MLSPITKPEPTFTIVSAATGAFGSPFGPPTLANTSCMKLGALAEPAYVPSPNSMRTGAAWPLADGGPACAMSEQMRTPSTLPTLITAFCFAEASVAMPRPSSTCPALLSSSGASSWYTAGDSTTCSPAESLALIVAAVSVGEVTYTPSKPTVFTLASEKSWPEALALT